MADGPVDEPVVVTVDEPVVVKRDPERVIGIDVGQNGQIDYIPGTKGQREVWIDGAHYEHCANDPDGCWLYRRTSF